MQIKYSLLINSLLLAIVTLNPHNSEGNFSILKENNNFAYRSCRVKLSGCRGGTGRRRIMSAIPDQTDNLNSSLTALKVS